MTLRIKIVNHFIENSLLVSFIQLYIVQDILNKKNIFKERTHYGLLMKGKEPNLKLLLNPVNLPLKMGYVYTAFSTDNNQVCIKRHNSVDNPIF